jgi:hypothetical protein
MERHLSASSAANREAFAPLWGYCGSNSILMSEARYQWPPLGKILPDLLAFVGGLGIAWMLGWRTTDLVWSLWLCSLVLGYLTILSTIGGGVYLGVAAIRDKALPAKDRPAVILLGTFGSLFLLGFFSLHFCGFHAGHAVFLSHFFPLQGLPKNVFSNAFMNPFLLWKTVLLHLIPVYGLFLIPAVVAERKYVFAALTKAVKAVHDGSYKDKVEGLMQSAKGQKRPSHDPFSRPYINVIRMHLLIFFFAFCFMLKVDSVIVYAVVYFVYFFPWSAFKSDAATAGEDAAEGLPEQEMAL